MTKRALFSLLIPLLAGCGGGELAVRAPRAEYPISFSRGVRDADGELVPESRRQVVGHFEWSRTKWTMFWKQVNLDGDADVSDAVNAQVAAVKGDAIVHFSVEPQVRLSTALLVQLIVGFIPSCSFTEFHGDIIRVLPASAAQQSAAAAHASPPPAAQVSPLPEVAPHGAIEAPTAPAADVPPPAAPQVSP